MPNVAKLCVIFLSDDMAIAIKLNVIMLSVIAQFSYKMIISRAVVLFKCKSGLTHDLRACNNS
jgi:hypothetical protein